MVVNNYMKLSHMSIPVPQELIQYYESRTYDHIECVQRNSLYLADIGLSIGKSIVNRCLNHDQSKFYNPELLPYIYISWKYKCIDDNIEFEIPENINDDEATYHHIINNAHHPEYWSLNKNENMINKNDRDAHPDEPINATSMDELSIVEMICDWHAVGLERGNTAKEWADKNVNSRWLFNDHQVDMIYYYIDKVNGQNVFGR